MREYPGEHAGAELVGIVQTQGSGAAELSGLIKNCSVELYAEGEERAIYSGIVQRAQSQEENGYRLLRLELGSGSLLMDMEKEKRTFQDISMTYGQVITRIASEAGMMAVYPRLLDETAIGFPVIQYRETDWEFIRRLASRFGMAVYPETTLGGGKLTVDLPQTGNVGELSCLGYTARIDRKFYQAGGEQEGRSREQYQTYEVRSMELRRVGDAVTWDGKHLFVCARKAELRDGMLEFVYILSGREWTWQKRLGNPKISGMSLLGTVEGCAGETVRLLLDIDRGRPAQLSYPWTWVPATGNLMYLMPQVGTRVSLYFKGEEETDAIAVNCIRSGDSCTEADYRDKSLTTEHGMQLRLNQGDMGVVSLKEKILLDDMEGIRIAGSGSLHILAAGEVKIAGSEVRVAGTGGVLLYEGTAEADQEGNIVVAPQGKIELSAEDGERAIHNRGKEVTYYLAWEHEDLSHPSNRYRDAPQQKNYDWMKLGTHVAAGLMVAGGIAALAAGGVLLLGGAAATAAKMAMTVFLAGSLYVGEQALSDIRSGRVSDLDQYTRKAVAGSVVGFLTGASGLLMTGASLGRVLALGFGEGLVGSIVTQKLLNEDGEIDWGVAIAEAGFSAVTAGFTWKERRGVRGVGGGGSEGVYGYLDEQLGSLKNKVDIKQYHSAESVNEWWSKQGYDNPPYTEKTVVQEITLKEDITFVRVYDGENSGMYGGWVMNANDIRGLTPIQIQDKFALPTTPKYVAEVKLNAGSTIRMGEANPIFGAEGGGTQFDLMGQYIGEFNEIGNLVDWSLGQ